jgi:Uma2 family endonuclease
MIQVDGKPKVYYPTNSLDELLGNKPFLNLSENVLIYPHEKEEQCVLTVIDNDNLTYSVADYFQLPEGVPYQLIEGKLIFMASPTPTHQKILGNLFLLLAPFINKNNLGEVFFAPLDTQFDDYNVYQPDLLFISKAKESIIKNRIVGSPDLVVEILSSKPKIDLVNKMAGYGKFGVSEYWVIDPKSQSLTVFENQKNKMVERKKLVKNGSVESKTIAGFSMEIASLFANPTSGNSGV